nr:hypothetical protein [Tanacetum cinerariifolium]
WRTSAPNDKMPARNTYSAEAVTILNTHRTTIQKQPEALLCLVGLSRRYYLGDDVYPTFLHDDDRGGYGFVQSDPCSEPYQGEDWYSPPRCSRSSTFNRHCEPVIEMEDPATATESSGVPSPIERLPLDFVNENPSQQSTGGNETEDQGQGSVAPEVIKERRKKGNDGVDTNAPPKESKEVDEAYFGNLAREPRHKNLGLVQSEEGKALIRRAQDTEAGLEVDKDVLGIWPYANFSIWAYGSSEILVKGIWLPKLRSLVDAFSVSVGSAEAYALVIRYVICIELLRVDLKLMCVDV